MRELENSFLRLVRLGIGHIEPSTDLGTNAKISKNVEWVAVKALADKQGLSAVILDGIEVLRTNDNHNDNESLPNQIALLEWIGEVMQSYEARYKQYKKAIGELAGLYSQHGIRMMVLKGYACSLDWPKPEHRPCGDIDIWLFGKQKEADSLLEGFKINYVDSCHDSAKQTGLMALAAPRVQDSSFKIDTSHHHHTVFNWKGFTIENHYDFVNVHAHRSSAELEKIFKELGQDDSHYVEAMSTSTTSAGSAIGSATKVYLPSPNLHALFLIKHMVSHFAAAEITLRQVLDWAFFVEKHTQEVDWVWLQSMLEKYHMKEFFNLINAICVDDLRFATDIFPEVRFIPELKEKVLVDILDPAYGAAEPASFFPRIIYKYRRWQGNAWKQKLCYSESRWESFWTGLWAKVLKPASI